MIFLKKKYKSRLKFYNSDIFIIAKDIKEIIKDKNLNIKNKISIFKNNSNLFIKISPQIPFLIIEEIKTSLKIKYPNLKIIIQKNFH